MDFKSPWSSIQMAANKTAKIVISGYIGIPEFWQHDEARAAEVVTTKEKMAAELKAITNLKVDTIEVEIDSFGGDVNHGLSIYNALATNQAQINIHYTGWAASVATVIGAAGNVVKAPNNFMGLIHEGRGGVGGTKSEIIAYADFLELVNDTAAKIYAAKAGGGKAETFRTLMAENGGEGTFRTAEDFKALGLIDEVYEPMAAAASYDLSAVEKEYGINTNTINMGLFKKDKQTAQVNSISLGDVTAVYEGELEAGVELAGVNAVIEDMTMDVEGNTLVIEKSILKSITPIQSQMIDEATAATMVSEAVAPVQTLLDAATADLVTMTAEKAELQTKYDNLAKLSSSHKPEKKTEVGNPVDMSIEQQISANLKEVKKATNAKLDKKRKGE